MSDTFYINKAGNKIIISSAGAQGVAGATGVTGPLALPERVSIS